MHFTKWAGSTGEACKKVKSANHKSLMTMFLKKNGEKLSRCEIIFLLEHKK